MKIYLISFGIVALLIIGGSIGGHQFFQGQFLEELREQADIALDKGDYWASLFRYKELSESAPEDSEEKVNANSKVGKTIDLIVAEEIYAKAKSASEAGNWLETKTFLQKSNATLDPTFKYYEEALALYVEAAKKIQAVEERIDEELLALRSEADEAEARHADAVEETTKVLEEKSKVEEDLQNTAQQKAETEEALKQKAIEVALAQEEANKEKLRKFLNEIGLYVDMLFRGADHLNDAITEIDEGKDSTALALINDGKVLFGEVQTRAEELLENRTDEEHKNEVRKLLQATALLREVARDLGVASFYIDQKDNNTFTAAYQSGKEQLNVSRTLLQELRTFINTN